MKFTISILFFGLVWCSCNTAKKAEHTALKGGWELSIFPSADKTFDELFGERKPELDFGKSRKIVTGTTGCNRFRMSYIAGKGKFSFGQDMIITKMACPGYDELLFITAFNKINRYQVGKSQLRLWQDSTLIMVFKRKQ